MKQIRDEEQAKRNRKVFDQFINNLKPNDNVTYLVIAPAIENVTTRNYIYDPFSRAITDPDNGNLVTEIVLKGIYSGVDMGLTSVWLRAGAPTSRIGTRSRIFTLYENWIEVVGPKVQYEGLPDTNSPFATWVAGNFCAHNGDLGFAEWKDTILNDKSIHRGLGTISREYIARKRLYGAPPFRKLVEQEIETSFGVKEEINRRIASGKMKAFWEKIDWFETMIDSGEFLKY